MNTPSSPWHSLEAIPGQLALPVTWRALLGGDFASFRTLYVLPGDTPAAGQTVLPDDLEQAAVEQVAYWFRNREKTGLLRSWPHDGTYDAFLQSDLLLEVRAVLKKYERFQL